MAYSTPDDGFREIQLNGKQLVFLFMAATVVSVVIFLCGILVGRGVRTMGGEASVAAAAGPALADTPIVDLPPVSSGQAAPPALAAPPPTPDELSYYDRLEGSRPPTERLRPAPAAAAEAAPPARAASRPPPQPPAAARPAAAAVAVASGDPKGPGYAVQVAALQARGEADNIARRLSGKGYPAYVMAPSDGAPASIYRVRIGKFQSRQEAEQVAARLEREEQFKPWVIR